MNVTITFKGEQSSGKSRLSEKIYNFLTKEGFNSIRTESSMTGKEDTIVVFEFEPIRNINKENE